RLYAHLRLRLSQRKSPPPTNRQAGNASAECPEGLSKSIAVGLRHRIGSPQRDRSEGQRIWTTPQSLVFPVTQNVACWANQGRRSAGRRSRSSIERAMAYLHDQSRTF